MREKETISLNGKTLFITGASRGIGLAIALRAAKEGANIAIAAKTTKPHPKLEGTIYDAAEKITKAGGNALPIAIDIRDTDKIQEAVNKTAKHFGALDICINNAGAIAMNGIMETNVKQYDLMHTINARATFFTAKACIPYLLKAQNPHILSLSPPLTINAKWFSGRAAYAASKYAMSLYTIALAEEFFGKIAINALWPKSTIATAAIQYVVGGAEMMRKSRKPDIVADAAHAIITKPYKELTGNLLLDEECLKKEGYKDFSHYSIDPSQTLQPDLFTEP